MVIILKRVAELRKVYFYGSISFSLCKQDWKLKLNYDGDYNRKDGELLHVSIDKII